MNKVVTQLGQTLVDIAVQESGTVESLFDLISLNNLTSIPLALPTELWLPSPIKPKIVEYIRNKNRQYGRTPISIATSESSYTGWFLPVTVTLNGVSIGTGVSGESLDFNLVNTTGDLVFYDIDGNDIIVDVTSQLLWELNYNGTDDVIFIPATVVNVGTFTSVIGSNVGTVTVSTDGVTYGTLSFPFTPTSGNTYYFKRSTATVNGIFTLIGTY